MRNKGQLLNILPHQELFKQKVLENQSRAVVTRYLDNFNAILKAHTYSGKHRITVQFWAHRHHAILDKEKLRTTTSNVPFGMKLLVTTITCLFPL